MSKLTVFHAGSSITYRPIGYVENAFEEPISGEQIRAGESRIVLDPALVAGLQGLGIGQQIAVVFHCHRSEGYELTQHPQGDRSRPRRGVFGLRSPRRPNPIGITVVELTALEGNVLRVRDLDAINNTPVLDIKPA
jgi:tRNA-Thr(GGU) m(6)t(6)A37 methyltransferase TsaA